MSNETYNTFPASASARLMSDFPSMGGRDLNHRHRLIMACCTKTGSLLIPTTNLRSYCRGEAGTGILTGLVISACLAPRAKWVCILSIQTRNRPRRVGLTTWNWLVNFPVTGNTLSASI